MRIPVRTPKELRAESKLARARAKAARDKAAKARKLGEDAIQSAARIFRQTEDEEHYRESQKSRSRKKAH